MHTPVLSKEVIQLLDIQAGDSVVDGTMNGGGHAREIICALGDTGTYVGIEWDKDILRQTQNELREAYLNKKKHPRIECVYGNYKNISDILQKLKIHRVDAIVLDLGFSSNQISDPSRGFSFQYDGPLDMRYDTTQGTPAYEIVNSFDERALADIFYIYGEERKSRVIAKGIVTERKHERIRTTGELKRIVEHAVGKPPRGIHPATRVFQALRICVNDELGNVRKFLDDVPSVLASNGRCAIISFHSLEDRIVKQAFREYKKQGIADVRTKKPITPSEEEISNNPRSRSAKLRVIEML